MNLIPYLLTNQHSPWCRHQMETFSALLVLYAGNSPVTGEFPAQRPVTRSFDIFFDLRLNKRLSKQSWGWWLDTPSRPLWRHCNDFCQLDENARGNWNQLYVHAAHPSSGASNSAPQLFTFTCTATSPAVDPTNYSSIYSYLYAAILSYGICCMQCISNSVSI